MKLLLHCSDEVVVLIVIDNGRGFDLASAKGKGFGLLSMRERLQALGGEVEIQSTKGQGTTVTARYESVRV